MLVELPVVTGIDLLWWVIIWWSLTHVAKSYLLEFVRCFIWLLSWCLIKMIIVFLLSVKSHHAKSAKCDIIKLVYITLKEGDIIKVRLYKAWQRDKVWATTVNARQHTSRRIIDGKSQRTVTFIYHAPVREACASKNRSQLCRGGKRGLSKLRQRALTTNL